MKRWWILIMLMLAGRLEGYGLEELPGWPFEASTFSRAEDTLRGLVFAGFGGGVVVGRVNPVDTSFEVVSDRIRAKGLVVDLSYDPASQKLALAVVPDRVEIWDVADPVSPWKERTVDVGECFEKGWHRVEGLGGVALGEGWLLVACGERGLLGMELSPFTDPEPEVVRAGLFQDVDRWGVDRVLVSGDSVFAVLDVTDWRNPVVVGSVNVGGQRITPGEAWAAVADWVGNHAWGVDLRDPEHPRFACEYALNGFAIVGAVWEGSILWVPGWDWIRGYVCEDTGRVVVEFGLPDSAITQDKMMARAGRGFVVFSDPLLHFGANPSLPFPLWVPPSRDTVMWLGGYRLPGHAFRVDRVGRWYAVADQAGGVRVLREEGGELVEVPTADVYPVDEVVWVDSTLLLASSAWSLSRSLQKIWVLQWNGQRFEVVNILSRACRWMVAVGDGKHAVCEVDRGDFYFWFYLLNLEDPSAPVVEDSMLQGDLYGDMKPWRIGDTLWIYLPTGRFQPFNMADSRDTFYVWTGMFGNFAFGYGWYATGPDEPWSVQLYSLGPSGIPDTQLFVLENIPPSLIDIEPWDVEFMGSLLFVPCGGVSIRWWGLCAYDLSALPDSSPPLVLTRDIGDSFMDLDAYGDTLLLAGVGLRRFRVRGVAVEDEGRMRPRLRVVPFPGGIRLEGDRPGIRVAVMDLLGRRVREIKVRGVQRVFLPRGVYVLRVEGSGEREVRKILIP